MQDLNEADKILKKVYLEAVEKAYQEEKKESLIHERQPQKRIRKPKNPIAPYKRNDPKIGRNELCPCGSGKKYKKCCGR